MTVEGEIRERRASLSDDELRAEISDWENRVAHATGFASAKVAAIELKLLVQEANERGWNIKNKYPIVRG